MIFALKFTKENNSIKYVSGLQYSFIACRLITFIFLPTFVKILRTSELFSRQDFDTEIYKGALFCK